MIPKEIRNPLGERIDFSFHEGRKKGVLLVIGHGVTGDKDRPLVTELAKGLARRGWPCLRISYTGNGESEGSFEDSCITKEIADLTAVLDSLPDGVLVAYAGHSMGAAVGVMTAANDPRIRVLISLAGMTHTEAFVEQEFGDVQPDAGFMWDELDCPLSSTYVSDLAEIDNTLVAAAKVICPWLLIHGDEDDVVPVGDGKDAYEAAGSEKQWVVIPGAGHSFDEESYPQLVDAMDSWLETHLL